MFAILVLMALFTTFLTTPAVMAVYRPLPRLEQASPPADDTEDEFRILACIRGPSNVPSLINLMESIHTTNRSPIKLYAMHLVEHTDQSSSILMVQRTRKNGFPFVNRLCRGTKRDKIASAFEGYGQLGRVSIQHSTSVSALPTMHLDICHVAKERSVEMIILPFHKQWRGEGEEAMESINHRWREVNQRVLVTATCSVAVLIDNGYNRVAQPTAIMPKRVAILFISGPDDREALEIARRMTGKQLVQVTLVRFLQSQRDGNKREKELDEIALAEFRRLDRSILYEEKAASNVAEEVLRIGKSSEYDILVVGKGQPTSLKETTGGNPTESEELRAIGDILTSGDHRCFIPSILVIQRPAENERIVSEMI